MKGAIDMSAVVGDEADLIRESDDELQNLLVVETDVDIFVVYKNKQGQGVLSFHIIIIQFMI